MRKLASIQVITSIEPIENADKIEYASVLGWHCVVKKGEFKVGDKCIYVEIDSILPSDNPIFDFMKDRKYRVKTIKLRGKISQGIIFPMSILPKDESKYSVGDDVTNILKIKKYEPEEVIDTTPNYSYKKGWLYNHTPGFIRGFIITHCRKLAKKLYHIPDPKKPFPTSLVPKTDETRVQSFDPGFFIENAGKCFSYSEKVDGSSTTIYYYNGHVGVCSRNMELPLDDGNKYVEAINKYDLIDKLTKFCKLNKCNIALQGELLGPGVQGNKYKLDTYMIMFFNAFNIDTQRYFIESSLTQLCEYFGLSRVPYFDPVKFKETADAWVELSKDNSKLYMPIQREGIVVRLYDPADWIPSRTNNGNDITIPNPIFKGGSMLHETNNYLSFKAINPNFLIKFDA